MQLRTNNTISRRLAAMVFAALVCLSLVSCRWADYEGTPPPTIQELMFEAITASEVHTAETDAAAGNPHGVIELPLGHFGLQVEEIPQPNGTATGPLVNQEFVETDIREALFLMSTDAEVNVVIDDEIRGVVNTSIVDMPFDAALEKVLLPFGYVSAQRNGQYYIAPPDPSSPLFAHIAQQHDFKPTHVTTKDLLQSLSTRQQAFVREVESANMLVIEAPAKDAATIMRRLRQLDQPVPQVVLEAIVCVVSPDCGFRFGIDWSHSAAVNGSDLFRLGAEGLALSGTVSPEGLRHLFDDFAVTSAFVKMLEEHGYLTIRAAPRVMAKDGEKANISIARETWFSITPNSGSGTGDNSALFVQNDIERVESGIVLDITPHIRGQNVTVEIERAEVSEDVRSANTELSANPFPVINRRTVSTTVHVQDGKTIVIGGLVQSQVVDRVSKVPGFSDLPIIGKLFKSVQRQEQDAEVVIFISPRIVTPTVAMERPESFESLR